MYKHSDLSDPVLFRLLKASKIHLAGNKQLLIYGQLNCGSGKRMNKINRMFFKDEEEALQAGYRPCGHCMREAYTKWKNGIV